MKSRLLARFALVLVGGVILVWIFGIDAGDSLLGTKNERVKVSEEEARRAQAERRSPDSDVALSGAVIPVREELEDQPGVTARSYTIRIGHTATGASKKMHAEDVSVDIFNKKAPPEERQVARIHGDAAWIYFDSAPDAAHGFQGANIDSMTLMQNVVVEYLNAAGEVVSEMRSETLDLSDQRFYVKDHVVISKEGMRIEGEELTYLKDDGSITLERNVKVEGTRFGLPSTEPDEKKQEEEETVDDEGSAEPPEPPEPEATLKTIVCDGRFTFVPAEEPDEPRGDEPEEDLEQVAALGGGLLTFRENVVASQGESKLSCDQLEITLSSKPPAEPGGKQELQVTHVVATGSPAQKATLRDPKATLEGETITLVETDAGQVITLKGEPRIPEAQLGETVFSAGARNEIRFRPIVTEATEDGQDEERIVLEMIEEAFLQTEGDVEGQSFRIEGRKFDLDFVRLEPEPAPDASDAPDASPDKPDDAVAPETPGAGMELRQLLATGDPQVLMQTLSEDGLPTTVRIRSVSGDLTYTPPKSDDEQTRAVFNGKTLLTVAEGDQVTTTMTSDDRLTILMDSKEAAGEGGGGLSSLVAEGNVEFENSAEHVQGTGETMTLFPSTDGNYRMRLSGTPERPALARQGGPDEEARVISALQIDFDPETTVLEAKRQVEARLAGLDFASGFGPGPDADPAADPAEASPAVLRCEKLTMRPDGEDGKLIEAEDRVSFDDPSKDVSATCHRLVYREAEGVARLYGNDREAATLTRSAPAKQEGEPPDHVSISGPLLLLEKASGRLTCPASGTVTLLRPAKDENGQTQEIAARSKGPIRYFEDRLVLHEAVVIGFVEDDTETRALWCDVATVFFSEQSSDEEGGGKEDEGKERAPGIGAATGSFDRIEAVGRVHLEQIAPKELIAEGQKLVWITGTDDEVMLLSGTNPQCWVVGLLGDKNVRDEADWFRLYKKSNEVLAENGRTVLLQDLSQR